MEEREYVKRQAAHVGLALPQFQDAKGDTDEFVVKTSPPMAGFDVFHEVPAEPKK